MNLILLFYLKNFDIKTFSTQVKSIKDVSSFHLTKVKSTLRQIARDWSKEGQNERKSCYEPILEQVLKHKPLKNPDVSLKKKRYKYYDSNK